MFYDKDNVNYRVTSFKYKGEKLVMKIMERSHGKELLKTNYEYEQRNIVKTTLSPGQEMVTNDYSYNINNDWIKKVTKVTNSSHSRELSTNLIITERQIIYLD